MKKQSKKWQQCQNHLCYKTDFLFAKSRGPQSYFRYTILNRQWKFCANMWKKKLRCIFYLLAFLENTCFVCISMGNGPFEDAITCTVKHKKVYYSKTHPIFLFFFLIFAENVRLLFLNITKLIPLGASTSKNEKSTIPMW